MKTNIFLFAIAAFLLIQSVRAQNYNQLKTIEGYNFKVYYSHGCDERAKLISNRVDKAKDYYENLLDFNASVTLLVLSPDDWSKYTNFPVYGMPHYNGDSILVVAADVNPFWKSFVPPVEQLPDDLREQVQTVYRTESGELSMQAFFNLLAVHQLGHAFKKNFQIRNC